MGKECCNLPLRIICRTTSELRVTVGHIEKRLPCIEALPSTARISLPYDPIEEAVAHDIGNRAATRRCGGGWGGGVARS
ncbi:hypothetical protein CRG98_046021 [Punica granatum]|uniref:Uncharacterized protein n=1 Tax=Punica granatum TaxID=22663 RepID=A0A2I0HPC4_PUNGR|nr:hypothetical protein CRG98_046021 [Punica granatum]